MRNALAFCVLVAALASCREPARAVPIFAERYGFSCSTCHTAVPDLNTFGDAFRRNGFTLKGVATQAEFPLALRFQETYRKDLAAVQSRRFNALAIAVSTANFGRNREYSYFGRYIFGNQGAAGSLYYGWLQHVNADSKSFQRIGLFGLPLVAHPSQRLDAITTQAAYAYQVGHSAANFATPRLGALFGRRGDRQDLEIAISFDEYHGAAYGAPTPPSEFAQSFAQPEIFASAMFQAKPGLKAGALALSGQRSFRSRAGVRTFQDAYQREGVQFSWLARSGRFDASAQQLWGYDSNADGFGAAVSSSGGFLAARYRPTAHSYVGARYDAAANPYAVRDIDIYAADAVTPHSRLLVEYLRPLGYARTQPVLSAQLLFALPFEKRR